MNRISYVVAIVCLFLVATVVSGQNVTPTRDTVVSGFFAYSDKELGNSTSLSRLHHVDLIEGITYCIGLESTEFNTSMLIEDLEGNFLAMDTHDSSISPGCIVFRVPATASYRLIASVSLPIRESYYRITMYELPSLFALVAELTPTDPLNDDSHERFYDVPLIAGLRYVIDMSSRDFDACLKVMTIENDIVAVEYACDSVRGARIVFTAPATEVVRLVATSATPYAVGTFRLNVCECD